MDTGVPQSSCRETVVLGKVDFSCLQHSYTDESYKTRSTHSLWTEKKAKTKSSSSCTETITSSSDPTHIITYIQYALTNDFIVNCDSLWLFPVVLMFFVIVAHCCSMWLNLARGIILQLCFSCMMRSLPTGRAVTFTVEGRVKKVLRESKMSKKW